MRAQNDAAFGEGIAVAEGEASAAGLAAGRAANGAAEGPAAADITERTTILLDGAAHAVPTGSTLAELVAALGHAPGSVATALNGAFVARADRPARTLAAGDAVLLFQPIVGG